jgi:serine/threonine protein kinase
MTQLTLLLLLLSLLLQQVTDFGVSAELQNSIAMCGTFVGTFKYMSPERMRSEKYSYASDMWSLGLVLMECATGQYPYVQDNSAIEMVQVSCTLSLIVLVAIVLVVVAVVS